MFDCLVSLVLYRLHLIVTRCMTGKALYGTRLQLYTVERWDDH
jgi:hypothetical protein